MRNSTGEMKKISWFVVLMIALSSVGCGLPGGGNYPYDMFDRDADTLVQLMKSGGDGTLKAAAVSDSVTLESLWGKTRNATIVKRVHVAMRAYYWIDVETTAGEKKQIFVGYIPNMGRVEVVVRDTK